MCVCVECNWKTNNRIIIIYELIRGREVGAIMLIIRGYLIGYAMVRGKKNIFILE